VKLNNFFTLGSGIFMTKDSGILLDFEVQRTHQGYRLKGSTYARKLYSVSDLKALKE
jgi:hypothetical protein